MKMTIIKGNLQRLYSINQVTRQECSGEFINKKISGHGYSRELRRIYNIQLLLIVAIALAAGLALILVIFA